MPDWNLKEQRPYTSTKKKTNGFRSFKKHDYFKQPDSTIIKQFISNNSFLMNKITETSKITLLNYI